MPRAASSHVTCLADTVRPRYQRAAVRITSDGQRYPAKAVAEVAVKSRPHGRQA